MQAVTVIFLTYYLTEKTASANPITDLKLIISTAFQLIVELLRHFLEPRLLRYWRILQPTTVTDLAQYVFFTLMLYHLIFVYYNLLMLDRTVWASPIISDQILSFIKVYNFTSHPLTVA
jgi:hypothetical protein